MKSGKGKKADPQILFVRIMRDSDVRFLLSLNRFIKELQAKPNSRLVLSLVGTCGMQRPSAKKMEPKYLYHPFTVDRVYKSDRGQVLSVKFTDHESKLVFEPRLDKVEASEEFVVSHRRLKQLRSAHAYSSNFLMHADEYAQREDYLRVYDMESYDFTVVCQQNRVRIGYIVRLVSDFFEELPRIKCTFDELPDEIVNNMTTELKPASELFGENTMAEFMSSDFRSVAKLVQGCVKQLSAREKTVVAPDGSKTTRKCMDERDQRAFWTSYIETKMNRADYDPSRFDEVYIPKYGGLMQSIHDRLQNLKDEEEDLNDPYGMRFGPPDDDCDDSPDEMEQMFPGHSERIWTARTAADTDIAKLVNFEMAHAHVVDVKSFDEQLQEAIRRSLEHDESDSRKELEDRLANVCYNVEDVERDGNCQFHALARQLSRVGFAEITHQEVRAKVVKTLRAWHDDGTIDRDTLRAAAIHDGGDIDAYLKRLAIPGPNGWGDHLTLLAAAATFEVTIYFCTTMGDAGICELDVPNSFRPRAEPSRSVILLGHEAERHWTSTIERGESASLLGCHARFQSSAQRKPGFQLCTVSCAPMLHNTIAPPLSVVPGCFAGETVPVEREKKCAELASVNVVPEENEDTKAASPDKEHASDGDTDEAATEKTAE